MNMVVSGERGHCFHQVLKVNLHGLRPLHYIISSLNADLIMSFFVSLFVAQFPELVLNALANA